MKFKSGVKWTELNTPVCKRTAGGILMVQICSIYINKKCYTGKHAHGLGTERLELNERSCAHLTIIQCCVTQVRQ